MIEATLCPDWAGTEKRRQRAAAWLLEKGFRDAEQAMADLPPEMVLRVARERSDTLGAAVDAIERGSDSKGEVRHMLTA